MRVTSRMVRETLIRNISQDMRLLSKSQETLVTGRKINRVSDDPVAASESLAVASRLRSLEQLRRNIGRARTRVDTEESVLNQVTDVLARARQLATQFGSDSTSASDRQFGAAEMNRLIEDVIQLGNTRVGSDYIFGGNQVTAPPFQTDGTYLGDSGVRQVEIGPGFIVDTVHSGQQAFVDSGVISSLTALRDAMVSGDAAQVRNAGPGLEAAFNQVQVLLTEVGARSRQYDSAGENVEALDSSFTLRLSDLEDAEINEVATEFVSIQNTLQTALTSVSRILNTSLTEFLR